MEEKINKNLRMLNNTGVPAIFVVTGNNSYGKTVLTRLLIQKLNFYQSINLGLVSKMIRFFRPDLPHSELENFDNNTAANIFKSLVNFIIDSYKKTGVDIIIDGIQVDPTRLFRNEYVLGGVILQVDGKVAIKRGEYPETHFNRKLLRLKKIGYISNKRFRFIDNSGNLEETYRKTLEHINYLLDLKLRTYG